MHIVLSVLPTLGWVSPDVTNIPPFHPVTYQVFNIRTATFKALFIFVFKQSIVFL